MLSDEEMVDVICGSNDWKDGGLVLPNNAKKIIAALRKAGAFQQSESVEALVDAVWQVLDDMCCFEFVATGKDYRLKDNSNNKNQTCCIDARDQLIEAYRAYESTKPTSGE